MNFLLYVLLECFSTTVTAIFILYDMIHSQKFDELQNSLNKSNEVFNTFRKEMDKVRRLKQ